MTKPDNIKDLLQKFVNNQCDEKELQRVIEYFQQVRSTEDFPSVEEVLDLLNDFPQMNEAKAEEIYSHIVKSKRLPKVKRNWKQEIGKYAAAAIFIGVVAVGYFSYHSLGIGGNDSFLVPVEEQITIQLENGDLQVIGEESINVSDARGNIIGTGNEKHLVYNSKNPVKDITYNTINVPYGKQFELSLADGTRVYLNAGTSLKYPVSFVEGKKREVFLTGEAFFEVSKDKNHPFVVNAEELKVQVLGTKFNVAAYPEDTQSHVVLVEGSVGMYSDGEEFHENTGTLLTPNYKGTFNKEQNSISKREVVTGIYTSWINGELVFRDVTFPQMIKRLTRHYNVKIINHKKEITEETFNANFGSEPIEKVLEYLAKIYKIEYTIEENSIIIN